MHSEKSGKAERIIYKLITVILSASICIGLLFVIGGYLKLATLNMLFRILIWLFILAMSHFKPMVFSLLFKSIKSDVKFIIFNYWSLVIPFCLMLALAMAVSETGDDVYFLKDLGIVFALVAAPISIAQFCIKKSKKTNKK